MFWAIVFATELIVSPVIFVTGYLILRKSLIAPTTARLGLLLTLTASAWMLADAVQIYVTGVDSKFFVFRMELTVITGAASVWLLFAVHFSGYSQWMRPSVQFLLAGFALVSIIIFFTNEHHHLLMRAVEIDPSQPHGELIKSKGLAMWAWTAYVYSLLFAGGAFIFRRLASISHVYQKQSRIIIAVAAAVFAVGFVDITDLEAKWQLMASPTAWVNAIGIVIVIGTLTTFRTKDLLPLAREMVVDSMNDIVIVLDRDGYILHMNPVGERKLRHSVAEALGTPVDTVWPGWSDQTSDPTSQASLRPIIALGEGSGRELYDVGCTDIRDLNGEVTASIHVLRDVTENRRMSDALRTSERRAIKALEELKLTQASLVQAEKLSALGQLVAGAAHELNNPLTAVLGLTDMLLEKDLEPAVRQDLEIIMAGASQAAKVVVNLSSFAQKQETQIQPVNLNEVMESVLGLKSNELHVNDINVESEFAQNLPMVPTDPSQIQSVFLNLVTNAQFAMTEAHGRGVLIIKTARMGDRVRVTVTDDGPGITPEHLGKIFDPFFTTKEVGEGMGMGLSICHGVVTRHGGRIWADSQYGHGATFHVELPVAQ